MKPFSDEDLASIKASCAEHNDCEDPDCDSVADKISNLIARLEAAEACIPHVYANRERFMAIKKWLHSKGEKE